MLNMSETELSRSTPNNVVLALLCEYQYGQVNVCTRLLIQNHVSMSLLFYLTGICGGLYVD